MCVASKRIPLLRTGFRSQQYSFNLGCIFCGDTHTHPKTTTSAAGVPLWTFAWNEVLVKAR